MADMLFPSLLAPQYHHDDIIASASGNKRLSVNYSLSDFDSDLFRQLA